MDLVRAQIYFYKKTWKAKKSELDFWKICIRKNYKCLRFFIVLVQKDFFLF